jgi:hypothetical protein
LTHRIILRLRMYVHVVTGPPGFRGAQAVRGANSGSEGIGRA